MTRRPDGEARPSAPVPPRPRISYLVAVRDESHYLPLMLDSWARQSSGSELVLVNDHSEDDTLDIARRFAAEHPHLSVYSLAEEGLPAGKVAAFNLAWSRSVGEFVIFLGGDDELPPEAVGTWSAAVDGFDADGLVAAFGKLQTISENPGQSGLVIPRGTSGNRSGGTTLMSRALADRIFPIPNELPSEDLWTGHLAQALAGSIVEVPSVVLHYRIHPGNSNPRNKPFPIMNQAMTSRGQVYSLILERRGDGLPKKSVRELETLADLESLRRQGRVLRIMTTRSPLTTRLRFASMASPMLWAVRQRGFRIFSGR